jgi:threonine aldolase
MAPVECDFGKRGSDHTGNGSAATSVLWVIDLRSDTVSTPSDGMRATMAAAIVGDDVYGDDPTVNALEANVAELLGKEAALFVTSGTQSNLCALMAHCGRGDEYIAGENAHSFKYEAGGAAVLGSIQPQTVRMHDDGSLDLEHMRSVVKPNDHHFARTKLLCLENTHDGKAQTVAQMHEAADVGRSLDLSMHLDGARLWNAAAATGDDIAAFAEPFDTVSVCLSKGLGAPMGSVLVGSEALILEAHKWRKMLGGALRQAGLVAAAGQFAIDHNRTRLVEDHANAAVLAKGLSQIDGVTIRGQNTNMVFAQLPIKDDGAFVTKMLRQDIRVVAKNGLSRMVTHIDITRADVDDAITAIADALR